MRDSSTAFQTLLKQRPLGSIKPGLPTARTGSASSKSPETANWLVQELTYHYQLLSAAYERSQRLQALVHPFLPHATWLEAVAQAKRGSQALPTEMHEVSILRLDVADFTQLMETQPLDLLLTDLNTYLDRLARLVSEHGGEVSKYLGDGFLAIFASADDAVQAGCALQKAAAEFNQRQAAQNRPLFYTRIGIDSGQVALVSLGSSNRQDRTVMGMPVNLAERLQAQATPGQVWLSQATFERLQDQAGCHCVGPVKVKGRAEPVVVYEKQYIGNVVGVPSSFSAEGN